MIHQLPRLFLAFDFQDKRHASVLIQQIARFHDNVCGVKIGQGMFTAFGPEWVRFVRDHDFPVFLDLKFHDIPATMADAVRAATHLGASVVTVHAASGAKSMQAARSSLEVCAAEGLSTPLLLGVTVLTHLHHDDLPSIGMQPPLSDQIQRLATLALNSGCDGLVCAPSDVPLIKAVHPHCLCVCPGIRWSEQSPDDQTRIATPEEAFAYGADVLVMGRSIWQAKNPIDRLGDLVKTLV